MQMLQLFLRQLIPVMEHGIAFLIPLSVLAAMLDNREKVDLYVTLKKLHTGDFGVRFSLWR